YERVRGDGIRGARRRNHRGGDAGRARPMRRVIDAGRHHEAPLPGAWRRRGRVAGRRRQRGAIEVPASGTIASHPLFACAFRPMFLASAAYALVALVLWLAFLAFGLPLPDVAGGHVVWHAHEMMFGFVLAAVTGFTLTAVPEFTSTAPFSSVVGLRFAALWLAGRLLYWL